MEGQAASTADRPQLDQRRATIAARAASVREGPRWRRLLTLAPALSVRPRDRDSRVDEPVLIDAARRAVALLPQPAEVARA